MTDAPNETLFAWTSVGDYRAYPQFLNVSRVGGRLRIMVRRLEDASGEHPVCGAIAEMFLPDDEIPRLIAALGGPEAASTIEALSEALQRVRNGLSARDSQGRVIEPVGNARLIEIIDASLTQEPQ